MKNKRIIKNAIYSITALAAMWLGWVILYEITGNDIIIPSVGDVVKRIGACFVSDTFYAAFGGTLSRTAVAFFISLVAAFVLAIAAYICEAIRGIFNPVLSFLRTLPTMAISLILLVWTSPKTAPLIITSLVSFPMLYSLVLSAVDNVGREYGELAKAYKLPLSDRIFKIYLPLSAPVVLADIGAQASLALKVTVSAEVLCSTYKSLGGMMSEAKVFLEMGDLFAITLIVTAVGLLTELAFFALKKLVVRWK